MAGTDSRELTDRNQETASDPRLSAWVSANAGSGKTTVLVRRVLRLLLHRDEATGLYTRPENILCLTYTKAAAAEMENRLFSVLSRWAILPEADLEAELARQCDEAASGEDLKRARRLFAIALDTKGGLKIHTIHAFCERLLHRFPIEAGVQADFDVLEDQERRDLRDEAIDQVLGRAAAEPGTPLGDALMRVIAATGEEGFRGIVDTALARQEELRAMHRLADGFRSLGEAERAGIANRLGVDANRSETDIQNEMASVLSDTDLDALLETIPDDKATERGLLDALAKARRATVDEVRASALCEAFLTQAKKPRKTLLTKAVREQFPELAETINNAAARVCDLARDQAALDIAGCTGALLILADQIIGAYERAKATRAALDYDDLIVRATRLLHSSHAAAWVLYKLDWGIDHILVDEAQDTSPPQWQVIRALAVEFFSGEGARDIDRTVFGVGDEKQSIYSFQGADPASFAESGRLFARMAEDAKKPFRPVPLTVSFRSTVPVLDGVDAVFAGESAGEGVVWDGQPVVHHAIRTGQAGLIELWPLEEPEEHDPAHAMSPHEETALETSGRDRLAARIARTILHWLDSGERLEARNRPMRPGDILILVRSRDALVPRLIRELKALKIPVAGADRLKLTEQLAVLDLLAAGNFVLMPEDDLTLATLLKSPLVGFDDDDLFSVAHDRRGPLWDALRDKAKGNDRYAGAVARLSGWLARADSVPPYEFFAGLLEEDGMRMRLALIGRLGPDAGDAIDEFLQLALDYERVAHPSLQGFIEWVRKGEADVKRDMEQGRDEVRIMTAHGAKGLEANVVILPDTCRAASGGGGNKPRLLPVERAKAPSGAPDHLVWVPPGTMPLAEIEDAKQQLKDAARREHNRLLYVAMTRAEDRLYIAGWKGSDKLPDDCWYTSAEDGLKGLLQDATSDLGEKVQRYATPQSADPVDRKPGDGAPPEPQALPDWARCNAADEKPAAMPLRPSSLTGDDEEGNRLAEQDLIPPLERPSPDRFLRGNIIHALLQYLPDVPPESWKEKANAFVAARGRQLDAARRDEIVTETLAVLIDDAFAPLFGEGSQAEVPIVAQFDRDKGGPVMLNGIVDRLLVRDNDVLIVDYKTNRPPPESQDDVAPLYIRQLAAYRVALGRIYPEKSVRAALLWTDGPRPMEIDGARLDEAAASLGIA